MISNKIQVVYRLPSRITLMWPKRPNAGNNTNPSKYNLYWDASAVGPFNKLLGSVENSASDDPVGMRAYHDKVVFHFIPEKVPGWIDDQANYVRLRAVIGGAEQVPEEIVAIPSYTSNGMRLRYPELRTTAIVGYDKESNQFIPVAVDLSGKVKTI